MAVTRKDYIAIADGMVRQIRAGYIKKKNIEDAIASMSYCLRLNHYNFMAGTFRDYIIEKI